MLFLERRSEERCQPWPDVLLLSEAEALKEAALWVPWQQLRLSWSGLVGAVSRASALALARSFVLELEKHSGDS